MDRRSRKSSQVGRSVRGGVAQAGLALLASVLLAACGSAPSAPSAAGAVEQVGSLTIASPTPAGMALQYIALDQGFFDKRGVHVEITDNQGPNVSNLVVSGAADIGLAGTSQPLLLLLKGKQTAVTFGLSGGGVSGSLVGAPGSTLATLRAAKDCKIGTYPPGTGANGYAQVYKRQLGLDNCTITTFNTIPLQLGGLVSGDLNAVVGGPANFAGAVAAGKATFLVNSADAADRAKYIPAPYWEVVEFGQKSVLKSKAAAVTAYYGGLKEAAAWQSAHTPDEVAAIIAKQPAAKGMSVADLAASVRANAPFGSAVGQGGVITEASWQPTLQGVATWSIAGFDPANPEFAYANMVDMSYLQGANASTG